VFLLDFHNSVIQSGQYHAFLDIIGSVHFNCIVKQSCGTDL